MMWLLIIKCSAESWEIHTKAFKAITAKSAANAFVFQRNEKATVDASWNIRLENVNDVEDFMEGFLTLDGY